MAEIAVSFAIDHLLPLLREEAGLLKGIHKEFVDLKKEMEFIQAFLKDADKRAARERDNKSSEGVKIWVKDVIEAAFSIEDIIDDYMICVAQQPRQPGFAALLHRIGHVIKTLKHRHRIASEIQEIKSSIREINERRKRYDFQTQPCLEQGLSSSAGQQNAKWHDPRMAALYMEDAEVVGFEAPKNRLIGWLVKGRKERTVVSVVGMGGQGKTTLAKKVFDSKEVVGHFDCRVWITVSESYSIEGLMREMLRKFFKQTGGTYPRDINEMDRGSLIDELRNYLEKKRYVVVFDDVWNVHFWDEIEFAVIDSKIGSKIILTTRKMDVVVSCNRSSFIEVHELQSLTSEQSWELFEKKAFGYGCGGCCPEELISISYEILKKCKGLPLAIVVIGALLSTKEKNVFEWKRFSENLISEQKKDSHLIGIKEILGFSYDDLPYYLKPCLLYFGIYPEDYEVKPNRLTWQWIAEGFVKEERGKTLEQVAEGYLAELIRRSLVQVSSIRIDEKVKACRVHDLVRLMILEKFDDLSFCKHISEDDHSSLGGRIRRLSIESTSEDSAMCIESSHVKSLLLYNDVSTLMSDGFVGRILTKYKSLKVIDFEYIRYFWFPKNLGNLIHLKYLRVYRIDKFFFPESIGLLQNLETLDLRGVYCFEVPKDINKLRKLRHLVGNRIYLTQLKDGIGGLTSLQTLRSVCLRKNGATLEIIRELGKLKQLKELGLCRVSREHGSALSSSICEMQNLEKLNIKQYEWEDEIIDLNLVSPPPMLQNITLNGKLERFPVWILELRNLIKLKLEYSHLSDDPMKSLKNMPSLLILHLQSHSYKGESLHFEDGGGFQKLKELKLEDLDKLNSIFIDKGALPSLVKLELLKIPLLNRIPSAIQHMEKLQVLIFGFMSTMFMNRLALKDRWVIKHVPHLEIKQQQ